jgi:hypothetical protein
LSLSGEPIQVPRRRRAEHRGRQRMLQAHDITSPWKVLNIQCYPDRHSTFDFQPRQFASGPEAFLVRLLAELRDTQKRYDDLHSKIAKLTSPPNVCISYPLLSTRSG